MKKILNYKYFIGKKNSDKQEFAKRVKYLRNTSKKYSAWINYKNTKLIMSNKYPKKISCETQCHFFRGTEYLGCTIFKPNKNQKK